MLEVLLSMVPGIEAMWASAYLICSEQYFLVPFAVALNFLAVLVFLKLLDSSKVPNKIEHFLEKRTNNRMKKVERWFQSYGIVILVLLIGLPFSGIGSFTGSFLGRVLEIENKKLLPAVFIGIAISIAPAFLIAQGVNILGIRCVQ